MRYVRDEQERGIAVGVSPTYTGCPATEVIQASIKARLHEAGFASVRVDSVLAPPWTSDWLTDSAREKLREYGIAPPAESVDSPRRLFGEPTCAVSAMLVGADAAGQRIRLDAVQSAVSLHELPRAVRIFQMYMSRAKARPADADLPSVEDSRSAAGRERRCVRRARRAATSCAIRFASRRASTSAFARRSTARKCGARIRSAARPTSEHLRIGVRVQERGSMSGHLGRELRLGDTLEVLPPTGRFILTPDAAGGAHILRVRGRQRHHADSRHRQERACGTSRTVASCCSTATARRLRSCSRKSCWR